MALMIRAKRKIRSMSKLRDQSAPSEPDSMK
jgi:hypothetical protein